MGDLPRIAVAQPVVRLLHLVAIVDVLLEDAVVVADAVADRRQLQRRHRVEEAGREPAQAAVAERGVDLDVAQHVPVQAELLHRLAAGVFQQQVDDVVAHRPADQELEREIADPLHVLLVIGLLRIDPPFDQPIANRQRQRVVAVLVGGGVLVLGQRAGEMEEEAVDQAFRIHAGLFGHEIEFDFARLARRCRPLELHYDSLPLSTFRFTLVRAGLCSSRDRPRLLLVLNKRIARRNEEVYETASGRNGTPAGSRRRLHGRIGRPLAAYGRGELGPSPLA